MHTTSSMERSDDIPEGVKTNSLEWEKLSFRYARLMSNARSCLTCEKAFMELWQTNSNVTVTPEEVDNCTQKLFSLPSSFPISHCKGYLKGNLLAIDKSSVYAVEALGIKPGNIVLDLCCAPGMKLACIADLVGDQGFVVGVDISPHRLDTTIAVMKKYNLHNVGLILEDGRSNIFSNDSRFLECMGGSWNNWSLPYTRERKSRARRKKIKHLDTFAFENVKALLTKKGYPVTFDKVLIDVECTHDASLRHVQKFIKNNGSQSFEQILNNKNKISDLCSLQKELLESGFQKCCKGGVIVYSTCSFSRHQNEEVVEAVVMKLKDTIKLDPLPFQVSKHNDIGSVKAQPVKIRGFEDEGNISCACRFEPRLSYSSGLFVCRLQKLL